jgi:Ca2+/H+ antiporter, TMEM165/GDT1 family
MDVLLTSLIAVFFAELGDRGQILTLALALRYRKNVAVLAGLMLATLLNCLASAAVGSVFDQYLSEEPVRLFTAMAYIFAGGGMLLWRRKVDLLENWQLGAFMTSFLGLFILQFGDKSQFLIAVNAAQTPLWGFAVAGGFAGIIAACAPIIFFGGRLAGSLPVQQIRKAAGAVMILWGLFAALGALKLI